jgi:hypothetical protein
MNPGSFRFWLGGFECIAVSDGAFNYPLESFFANVSREQVQETLCQNELPTNRINTPYTTVEMSRGEPEDSGLRWLGGVLLSTSATCEPVVARGLAEREPGAYRRFPAMETTFSTTLRTLRGERSASGT